MGFGDWVADTFSSGASAVGDFVEGAVDTGADIVEEFVDGATDAGEDLVNGAVTWVGENAPFLGPIANILGGAITGTLEAVRDFTHDGCDIARDVGRIIGSVLRGDLTGIAQGFTDLFIHAVDLVLDATRFALGGYVVGGIIEQFEREELRKFVKQLLRDSFGYDEALLGRIREKVRITSADWGLDMPAVHLVLFLDSLNTPLWQWHEDGTLDLYALAGFGAFSMQRPRTWVRIVDANGRDYPLPVNRTVIREYLASNGNTHRLRVYAMDKQATRERLRTATDKCGKIGVHLAWNGGDSVFGKSSFATHEIRKKEEYLFVLDKQESFVFEHGLRTGAPAEECTVLAIAAFAFDPDNFGKVGFRDIHEGDEAASCSTPARDDDCCNLVGQPPSRKGEPGGSSVVHRDVWPPYVFKYVLAHEIGHYLGLCHYGHDGIENVMYTKDAEADLDMVDAGTLEYYYSSEPEFTVKDGKNAWRFIVHQLPCCLDEELCPGA